MGIELLQARLQIMDPLKFERLYRDCLQSLATSENETVEVIHGAGVSQAGADVFQLTSEGRVHLHEVKRRKQINLEEVVERLLKQADFWGEIESFTVVFAGDIDKTTLRDLREVREKVRAFRIELVSGRGVTETLLAVPRVIYDYFGPTAVEEACGTETRRQLELYGLSEPCSAGDWHAGLTGEAGDLHEEPFVKWRWRSEHFEIFACLPEHDRRSVCFHLNPRNQSFRHDCMTFDYSVALPSLLGEVGFPAKYRSFVIGPIRDAPSSYSCQLGPSRRVTLSRDELANLCVGLDRLWELSRDRLIEIQRRLGTECFPVELPNGVVPVLSVDRSTWRRLLKSRYYEHRSLRGFRLEGVSRWLDVTTPAGLRFTVEPHAVEPEWSDCTAPNDRVELCWRIPYKRNWVSSDTAENAHDELLRLIEARCGRGAMADSLKLEASNSPKSVSLGRVTSKLQAFCSLRRRLYFATLEQVLSLSKLVFRLLEENEWSPDPYVLSELDLVVEPGEARRLKCQSECEQEIRRARDLPSWLEALTNLLALFCRTNLQSDNPSFFRSAIQDLNWLLSAASNYGFLERERARVSVV